jgi:molybdate transport system ATP-binding protein
MQKHWAVFINNNSNKTGFIGQLLSGRLPVTFVSLNGKKTALFSKLELDRFIEEEERQNVKRPCLHTS